MGSISNVSTSGAIESVIAAKQSATQSKIAFTVAGKAHDAHRAAGDAAVELIEAAGQLGAAEGKGASLDAVR